MTPTSAADADVPLGAHRARSRPRARLLAVLALLSVLTLACGSGGAAGAGGPSTPDAAGRPQVRLANFGQFALSLPLPVALHYDLFAKHGVDLVVNPPQFSGVEEVRGVITGDSDMAMVSPSLGLAPAAAGQDVVTVARLTEGSPTEIVLLTATIDRLKSTGATPGSPYEQKLSALKGLTIATAGPGTFADGQLRFSLRQHGLDPDQDLTIQTIADASSQSSALRQGRVDGVLTAPGVAGYSQISEGAAAPWINFGVEDEIVARTPIYGLVTSTAFVQQNPEAVRGVVAAFQEALSLIKSGLPAGDLAAIKKTIAPDLDQAVWDLAIQRLEPMWSTDLTFSESQFTAMLTTYNASTNAPVDMDYATFVDNDLTG